LLCSMLCSVARLTFQCRLCPCSCRCSRPCTCTCSVFRVLLRHPCRSVACVPGNDQSVRIKTHRKVMAAAQCAWHRQTHTCRGLTVSLCRCLVRPFLCFDWKNHIKSARRNRCPATKRISVLMKKVYEQMCDRYGRLSDRVLRRRALQSYLLYDARGTAAIFGLPGKSTGEGSISSINTACAHRIGRGQVWIPCDCHGSWTRIYRGSGAFTRAVSILE